MSKCPVCQEVIDNHSYYMIALERPYINIYFHIDCYKTITDITEFLKENIEQILLNARNKK